MGLKQLPKCKESDCRFNHDCKYCTILTEKPKGECRFKKNALKILRGKINEMSVHTKHTDNNTDKS